MSDEETEDDYDIDNILEEEFPKEEEAMSEEEEEPEADAIERLRGDLLDKFETDTRYLQGIQVINFFSFFIIRKVTFEHETKEIWFMP